MSLLLRSCFKLCVPIITFRMDKLTTTFDLSKIIFSHNISGSFRLFDSYRDVFRSKVEQNIWGNCMFGAIEPFLRLEECYTIIQGAFPVIDVRRQAISLYIFEVPKLIVFDNTAVNTVVVASVSLR